MLSAMLFDFRYAPGRWQRTVDCKDWSSARLIATGAATRLKAQWVELHSRDGKLETRDCVDGKWEQVNA
jgi:hypothetical protein